MRRVRIRREKADLMCHGTESTRLRLGELWHSSTLSTHALANGSANESTTGPRQAAHWAAAGLASVRRGARGVVYVRTPTR